MMDGIKINGIPLDDYTFVDLEVQKDSFTFHYIHKPSKARGHKPRALRRSPVRKIEVKDVTGSS
jgi:hypothetical protein